MTGPDRPMPRLTRLWASVHHHELTRLDWYIVGEKIIVILCAGIVLLYAMGVIR